MFAIAIALLIVAITLSIGVQVTDDLASNYVNNTLISNQVDNESWLASNQTTYALTNPDRVDSTSLVVKNDSTTLEAANYTLVSTTPATLILLGAANAYNDTSLNVSYSYDTVGTTEQQDVFDNGTQSIGELASWLPTIALVLAASLIIGVIVLFFRRRI